MEHRTCIVIPSLNEAPVIERVVRGLRNCLPLQRAGIQDILVVDNGSTDGTAAIAAAAGARVVREPRRGYGRACLTGVLAASQAEVIVLMDADGSDVPEDILRVWEPVQAGAAALVMGSRVRGRCEPGALTPQQRAGNAVGTLLLRGLYGLRVSDLGPLRAIRRETLLKLEMREMTYGWSTEMLTKAASLGLTILEVPVDYRRRAGGQSKVAGTLRGTLKASGSILRTIARYRHWQPVQPPAVPAPDAASMELMTPKQQPEPPGTRRALFLVARLPLAGQTKTRLGRAIGDEQAARLYGAFLRDLGRRFTQAARADGYDLYWCYAAPDDRGDADFAACVPAGAALLRQQGQTLAERLWSGFRALAARGYEQIVVLGSDSPHVPAAWITQAFAALEINEAVIGPSRDGGYYLLGQRALPAPVDLFTGITMSTATVCAETVRRAEEAGMSVAYLPATFDVDEASDLALLRAALAGAPTFDATPAPETLAHLQALALLQPDAPPALLSAVEG
jgi:rSAM/selenodomain-associated transferase 1